MLATPHRRRQGAPPRPKLGRRARLALFRLFYGPAAPIYDRLTHWAFLGEWQRWQRAALALLPERGLVVELGPGTADLVTAGGAPERPWLGIEPTRAMLRVAGRRIAASGALAWLVRGRAQQLPIAAGAAAAVLATFPGPYIDDRRTAAELRRVLAPGGRVVILLHGELAPDGPRRTLRHRAFRLFYGQPPTGEIVPELRLAGFSGTVRRIETDHGRAWVYAGTPTAGPATTAGGGRAAGAW